MKIKELLSLFQLSCDVRVVYLMRATPQPQIPNDNLGYTARMWMPPKTTRQTLTSLKDLSVFEDGEIDAFWINGGTLMIREKGVRMPCAD